MKTSKKPSAERPAVPACPSCGRRPSERVALGWKPEYEAPTTLACNDRMHDDADCGPALFDACDAWSEEGGTDEALEAAIEKLRGVV